MKPKSETYKRPVAIEGEHPLDTVSESMTQAHAILALVTNDFSNDFVGGPGFRTSNEMILGALNAAFDALTVGRKALEQANSQYEVKRVV